jgi:hypothetical protein
MKYVISEARGAEANPDVGIVEALAAKRTKRPDKMSLLKETMGIPSPTRRTESGVAIDSPQAMVKDEIDRYMQVEKSDLPVLRST